MKRKTVSLCMIARDEEASIGLAIKSVLALVDEVIVVDTGSRDNTRIIAEGYGARVIDLQWQDDFAEARNAALAEATCDWILVLDADERLQPVRPVEFQRMLHDDAVAGFTVRLITPRHEKTTQETHRVRLFRNVSQARYRYPIHERIQPSLAAWGLTQGCVIRDSGVSILHEGYRSDASASKRDRNLRILKQAILAHPEESYFEYRLACESLVYLDDEILPVAGLQAARQSLEQAWQKVMALPPDEAVGLSYGPDLAAKIGACRLAAGRLSEAGEIVNQGRALYGDHAVLLLQNAAVGTHHLRLHADDQAPARTASHLAQLREDLENLLGQAPDPARDGGGDRIRGLYPLRYLGELALCEGRVGDAAEYFEKALTVDGSFSFAWLGLAECARFAGDRKRALKLYLRTVTENEWNHRAWLRGCGLLEELGFHDNALSWRRKVAVHFPEHPDAETSGQEAVSVETLPSG